MKSSSFKGRFQFTLRAMQVAMLLTGCALLPLITRIHQAQKQKAAVDAIVAVGGWVHYEHEFDSDGRFIGLFDPPDTRPEAPGPLWIRSLLGDDDLFCRVQWVGFPVGNNITDAKIQYILQSLTGLEKLWIFDAGKATDVGLAQLSDQKELKLLFLGGRGFTDASFRHLRGLDNIEVLLVDDIQITDQGLHYVTELKNLHTLSINYCEGLTDAGLQPLHDMTTIQELSLSGTNISDAGLVHLNGLPKLQVLGLDNTRISDTGIRQLREMRNLQRLDVWNTEVTEKAVEELQEALPNCEIRIEQPPLVEPVVG